MNAPIEYYLLQEKLNKARTKEEKIAIIEEMIKTIPKHKGTENELIILTKRLAKLKSEKSIVGKAVIGIKKIWPRISIIDENANEIAKNLNLKKLGDLYFGIIEIEGAKAQLVVMKKEEKGIIDQSELVLRKQVDLENILNLLKEKGIVIIKINNKPIFIRLGETLGQIINKEEKNFVAYLYGKNAKFQGKRIGLNYKPIEGDEIKYDNRKRS